MTFVARLAVLALGAVLLSHPAAAQPKSLTLGTASVGGVFFVYGQVWANIAADAIKVPISTRQTDGPNHNIILVETKQVDLGMTTMGVALQAWKGDSVQFFGGLAAKLRRLPRWRRDSRRPASR